MRPFFHYIIKILIRAVIIAHIVALVACGSLEKESTEKQTDNWDQLNWNEGWWE